MKNFSIVTFYKFCHIAYLKSLQQRLIDFLSSHQVRGTILIATEGFNSTLSIPTENCDIVLSGLREITGQNDIYYKISYDNNHVFGKLKIKIKPQIITIRGVDNI